MKTNRIITGDCVKEMKGLPTETFDDILTDPPYGVTTDLDDYVATGFLKEAYRVLKPDAALMMFVGQATIREFWNAAESAGFTWLNTIVWHYKNTIKRQRKSLAIQYDPILYFSKGGFVHNLDNVRVPYLNPERLKYPCNNSKKTGWMPNPKGAICGDVWESPAINAANGTDPSFGHKWQKPLVICERMVQCTCNPGDLILDPFCGSGTQCVAAKNCGVDFVGIEVDEDFAKLARDRLSGKVHKRKVHENLANSRKMIDIFED